MIGVAGRAPIADMQGFVSELGLTGFEHLADTETTIWSQYGITSQPAFVFINDDGATETIISALGQEMLTAKVENLIAS